MRQSSLFGIFNDSSFAGNVFLINFTPLIFKLYDYKSRKNHMLNLFYIITNMRAVKTFENKIASVSDRKSKNYHKKQNVTEK